MKPPHSVVLEPEPIDYIGYCINLAVRLQDYCPKIGFIVHGVLRPELEGLGYFDAINLKGAQTEPVAMFREDLKPIPFSDFKTQFTPRS